MYQFLSAFTLQALALTRLLGERGHPAPDFSRSSPHQEGSLHVSLVASDSGGLTQFSIPLLELLKRSAVVILTP